jgi:hypothetical protein
VLARAHNYADACPPPVRNEREICRFRTLRHGAEVTRKFSRKILKYRDNFMFATPQKTRLGGLDSL